MTFTSQVRWSPFPATCHVPHTSVKKTFYFSIECKRSHISIVLIQKSKVLKCNKTTFGATLQETVLYSKMFCQVVHSGITSINNVIILSYILALLF